MEDKVKEYRELLADNNAESILKFFIDKHKGRIGLASSFGAEDQVLTDMLNKIDRNIPVFTLDTGRLHQQTYDVIEETIKKYTLKIKILFPESKDVEDMVSEKGPNLFYYGGCCKSIGKISKFLKS
ncbi:phosphoadenosine phosphosulfate reductase family protein [bacterium]|nr:phosphoadenosine phosphosulfate reductase family protein [bacterium]